MSTAETQTAKTSALTDALLARRKSISQWIKRATGHRVDRLDRLESSGASREIWFAHVVSPEGRPALWVVRRETDGGLFSGSPFNLRRETAVLDRVKQLGGCVPAVHGVTSDGRMMLMEHLPGRSDYEALSPAEQQAVADDCTRRLAELHQIGMERIRFTRSGHSNLPSSDAIIKTLLRCDQLYRDPYEKSGATVGWLNDALRWLDDNAPSEGPPIILQGDAGPPNFMFEGSRITGLIDWELTHAGDPADDLSMIYYRMNVLRKETGVEHWFQSYAKHAHSPYDSRRVTYFIFLNFVRSALAGWSHLQRNPDFGMSRMDRNEARCTAMLHHVKGSKTALIDHGVAPPPES